MIDITVFGFDKKIAKELGVEEAILHEWIKQQCTISQATKRTAYFRDDKWWFPLTEEVKHGFFPFWSNDKISRMLERLKNRDYIEVEPKGIGVTTKIPLPKMKRKKATILGKDEAEMYKYHKEVDGMVVEVVEPATVVVNYLIDRFQYITPNYESFYSIPPYRKSLMRMLKNYKGNVDMLLELLRRIPTTNTQKFAPSITTPAEFERLAPKLIGWIQKEEGSNKNSILL